MANHMETYIEIKNGNKDVADKLRDIFQPKEGEWESHTEDIYKALYGDEAPEEYDRSWVIDNIGAKWITADFTYDEDPKYIELRTTSAWSVPIDMLEKLANVLAEIKEDCYIIGVYEDESFDPCGAFVYAGGYTDIEDWDGEIDYDKIWEDDDYRDDLYTEINYLRTELEEQYLEYLQDKMDNPEDYI
jgi:hypothetical protein